MWKFRVIEDSCNISCTLLFCICIKLFVFNDLCILFYRVIVQMGFSTMDSHCLNAANDWLCRSVADQILVSGSGPVWPGVTGQIGLFPQKSNTGTGFSTVRIQQGLCHRLARWETPHEVFLR